MSVDGTIHIVGAGLAGLSAAVQLARAGRRVALYEAGSHAGGRCRSYYDKELGCVIDNGNHLMLSCNMAALDYLNVVGASDTLSRADKAFFPFYDLQSSARWQVKINDGWFPSWLFDKNARVPGARWHDYLEALKLLKADRWATVGKTLNPDSVLYRKLWQPLTVAIMNTQAEEASARMLGQVFAEMFGQGGEGCRPMTAAIGLSESFVDPALGYLKEKGATVHFGRRLRAVDILGDVVTKLSFATEDVPLGKWDWLVLALPAWVINDLLPHVPTPTQFRSIVNGHFKVPHIIPQVLSITGIIGGHVEWVFEKAGMVSTTTSAAERIVDKSAEEIAVLLWHDLAALYGQNPSKLPPYRIVKEKRATFAATPEEIIRRPKITVRHQNLVLCGDWTNTGLPSTIEGAIRSGRDAARCIAPVG